MQAQAEMQFAVESWLRRCRILTNQTHALRKLEAARVCPCIADHPFIAGTLSTERLRLKRARHQAWLLMVSSEVYHYSMAVKRAHCKVDYEEFLITVRPLWSYVQQTRLLFSLSWTAVAGNI